MNYIFLCISACTFLSFSPIQTQTSPSDPVMSIDSVADNYYEGGVHAFLEKIYKQINYPMQARENCRTGRLIVHMSLSESGRLARIEFQNPLPLGYGIEEEVVRMLTLAEEDWHEIGIAVTARIDFVFRLGDMASPNGDINVVAYSPGAEGNCALSRETLEAKLAKAEKKVKADDVAAILGELLRRYPEDKTLLEKYDAWFPDESRK